MKTRVFFLAALVLLVAQASFGATISGSGGTASSCTNLPGAPFNPSGDGVTLYSYFDCKLYPDVSSYSFPPNLQSLMTFGGAALSDNIVGAGYYVVINGDPNTLPNNGSGLYNESLWKTVLFFSGDYFSGLFSDNLSVYWPAAFPVGFPATVAAYNDNILNAYGLGGEDSLFFIQYTPSVTVYQPGLPCDGPGPCSNEYDIYTNAPTPTPEPGTVLPLASGLALLGGALLRKRRGARRVA
jgi:hypothetical protein